MAEKEIDLFLDDFDKIKFKNDVEFLIQKIDFVKNQKFEIKVCFFSRNFYKK